jgi:hypothetical protein
MKKLAALVLLFFSVNVFAQQEAAEDTASTPVITAIGKAKGKKTELKLNKDGGSLRSSDGLLELVFPSGALSKKTVISIQPIAGLMINGDGTAYRFEPSGIQFQKPVRVVFHYDEQEIKDSLQLLQGIAMQDDKGQWYSLNETTVDTVAKTIGGNISHFSDWTKFDKIKIDPSYARLKVKKTMNLTINVVSNDNDGDDLLASLSPVKKKGIPWRATWMANDIINGNATEGKIAATSRSSIKYTAPATLPPKNPVAVTADLTGIVYRTKIKGTVTTFEKLRLVSNVLIFDDAYEVTMISEVIDPGIGSNLGSVVYRDTGSFVISLNGNQARIIERVNKNIAAALNYSGGCCYNLTTLKTGHGNIHIAGTPVIKVIPSLASGKSATVEINFARVPSIFPLFQVTCQCPGDKSPSNYTNAMGVAMMAGILPTQPIQIKFEAKEGEQTILEHGKPGGQLYAKITVKQIKED